MESTVSGCQGTSCHRRGPRDPELVERPSRDPVSSVRLVYGAQGLQWAIAGPA